MLSMTLSIVLIAAALAGGCPSPRPSSPSPLPFDAVLGRRALQHARTLIQLRMLQLREERLECVREAILRRLPADLVPEPTGSPEPVVKQSDASLASKNGDCKWTTLTHKRRALAG